jgi:hypothetical protein
MANPEKGSLKERAAHLLGSKLKGKGPRVAVPNKIEWIGSTEDTIAHAQLRAIGEKGETLYLRNYKEGLHMVIVQDGEVKDQFGLVSQYALKEMGVFKHARVEQRRRY